jgi:hypothetical protein
MMTQELIARAQALCRHRRIYFPSDLRQYAYQWQREQFDLEFCWRLVKSHLSSGRPLWPVEAEIRRHHDRLRSEKGVRDRAAGEPLATTHATGEERWWETQGPEQVSDEDPQEYLPSPTPAMGVTGGPGGDRPCAAPRQPLRPPRQPYRKRTDTKASRVREFLKAHVVLRGPAPVLKLERMAKNEGLLEEDQPISRCSTFRRAKTELDIESKRVGYGPGADYVWRVKPPTWTQRPELGVHG